MMQTFKEWATSSGDEVLMVLLSTTVIYSVVLLYTRVTGLRSFSKMSAADFAMTVAVGSLFAATISAPSPTLTIGIVALAALFAGQLLVAVLRRKFTWFSAAVDNPPLLLMAGRRMIEQNLKAANVTQADIYGKLREANALNYDEVLAVVFEATGDISVLHRSDESAVLEEDFIKDVKGYELLRGDA